ncbi:MULTISPECIES: cell division protein [unclassified Neisseria]|uniref:cell division protein n=1 Tax=unclassified Neisseria TaxID=2623750 RepID=UPI0026650465|nr:MULTISPECIES: cell division protein [unclassified Neisseria]MDO1509983.1 cell division protein [Neisseria sp. MVDL19-042950]MDO1516183.1 cell division protein [Neisseria sp. MVDL18-041461]MDO1563298.1 cell division protein [Neisseria sp. MVDL20-010259]
MKWLFAVLVALNIIVFGGMVASRVAEKQKTVVEPTVPIVGNMQHELSVPEVLNKPSESPVSASDSSVPDWITSTETSAKVASEPSDDEKALAERERKAKEEQLVKEKKEREEKEKREKETALAKEQAERKEQKDSKETAAANDSRQCTASASITLDEDDYHRIKGLLKNWPHVAARKVEKRAHSAKNGNQAQKTYRVLLSSGGDAVAQLNNLSDKGFSATIYEGDISVGVTRSKSAAQVLISRLATAGFGGARIQEQEDRSNARVDSGLSVAKMQITFVSVDDKSAKEIESVLERYGKLNRKGCK